MNPCIKYCFPQINPSFILDLSCALYSVYTPPRVWLDLLSTFVLTPFFIFSEEDPDFVPDDVSRGIVLHPALPVDLGLPQELPHGARL